MLIFSILNDPRSFLVYSSHFDVFLSYRTNILCFFPRVEVILHIAKNDAKCGDVDPLTTKLAYYKHQLLCFAQGVGGGGGGSDEVWDQVTIFSQFAKRSIRGLISDLPRQWFAFS